MCGVGVGGCWRFDSATTYVRHQLPCRALVERVVSHDVSHESLVASSGNGNCSIAWLATLLSRACCLRTAQVYVEQSDSLCALVGVLGSLAALTRLDLSADGNFGLNRCLRKWVAARAVCV